MCSGRLRCSENGMPPNRAPQQTAAAIWASRSGLSRSAAAAAELGRSAREARMRISREVFDEQRRPRFGTANPERMRLAFWE
jgi:hypothetical protein